MFHHNATAPLYNFVKVFAYGKFNKKHDSGHLRGVTQLWFTIILWWVNLCENDNYVQSSLEIISINNVNDTMSGLKIIAVNSIV